MNTRIQFELSEARVKDLERLMEEAGIATRRDLFNNALSLLEWVVKEVRGGRSVASIDEASRNYKELVMPALASVVSKSNAADRAEPPPQEETEENIEPGLVFASAK